MSPDDVKFVKGGSWRGRLPWLLTMVVLAVQVLILYLEGRIWWCACGLWNVWDGDIWSVHNSQHWLDPYSFTHVLHGVLLCGVLAWLAPRWTLTWRLALAVVLEAGWEVLENSAFIIQRYREATIGQGYIGDSIANSLADVVCCAFGFLLARRLGLKASVVLFVIVEVALALAVRDNLSLNVLMLIHPIDAVKAWQMVH
jgi:hypothetical protein